MNIVILAGGTGSIALQTGIYQTYEKHADGIDVKVIVNAYDNGLSTGAVRRVLGGKILGPSDVRKNQTTRLLLENPSSPWNKFLDVRFTVESSRAKQFCLDEVEALSPSISQRASSILTKAIEAYFSATIAGKIDYTDFSLANIIYAGLAKLNGNSMRAAATIMSGLLGIKDNVLLNDDASLFLGAITRSGTRVTDESDIVSWGNKDDPFVDVFFTDAEGNSRHPVLCDESREAIIAADLIIASSGTQWSSLIPTYASVGFTDALARSKAKILLVMNRYPDKDSPGQTASDIVRDLIPRYFPQGRVRLLIDSTGHEQMREVDQAARQLLERVISEEIQQSTNGGPSKHNSSRLALAVGEAYFGEYLDSEHFMFDYDDTLVGRGNKNVKSSNLNKYSIARMPDASICTGNSIKAVNLSQGESFLDSCFGEGERFLTVFADGGVNEYRVNLSKKADDESSPAQFVTCINSSAIIPRHGVHGVENIIAVLKEHGIPLSKIENRGNVVICVKPIDEEYRPAVLSLIKILLQGTDLTATLAGRTSIDIMRKSVMKSSAVQEILRRGAKSITFVGDEFENGGNDASVAATNDPRVKCLPVTGPAMTAFFMITEQKRHLLGVK